MTKTSMAQSGTTARILADDSAQHFVQQIDVCGMLAGGAKPWLRRMPAIYLDGTPGGLNYPKMAAIAEGTS